MKCVNLNTIKIDQVCFDSKKNEMLVYFQNGDIIVFISFNVEIFDDFVKSNDPDSYYQKHLLQIPHEIRR